MNALVAPPENVLALRQNTGSSFELNVVTMGRMQVIAHGLPQIQMDNVAFGLPSDLPQVQLTLEAFEAYEHERAGALIARGEPGEVCPFDPESEDPVFQKLGLHELAIGELWKFSEWLRGGCESLFGNLEPTFREHRELLCRVGPGMAGVASL